jgi:uncharacterized protein involved in response to NO
MLSPSSDAARPDRDARPPVGVLERTAGRSLFACSFRPLFFAAALQAAFGIAAWMAVLGLGLASPAVPGGPLVWHAHEMLFGFGLAAVAGFVLTAAPEFTGTPAFGSRVAVTATFTWLAARIAFWLSGVVGPWPAALFEVALAALLVALVGPRLRREPDRRHLGFLWGLLAMAAATAGFHAEGLLGGDPMRWVHVGIGAMMALIVVAMSRVSMRIVNDALDAARVAGDEDAPEYRARPPRRNLAVFAISLFTAAEFAAPGTAFTGWLALAAAAAVLNLLNDWHVGRPLLTRLPAILYAVYWLMALGYAAIGVALLGGDLPLSAGRHLLTTGAMGLSVFAVLCIAGRIHSGYPLDARRWVPIGAALLVAGALARAAAGLPGAPAWALIAGASLCWIAAYGLVLRYLAPIWWTVRPDGGHGCEERIEASPSPVQAPLPP